MKRKFGRRVVMLVMYNKRIQKSLGKIDESWNKKWTVRQKKKATTGLLSNFVWDNVISRIYNNNFVTYESVLSFHPRHSDFWKKSKFYDTLQFNFETGKPNALKSCKRFKVIVVVNRYSKFIRLSLTKKSINSSQNFA